jgi:hypothetical protein
MKTLCRWFILTVVAWTMLQFVDASMAEARRGRRYVQNRHVARVYVAPRYRASPGVHVAAPGVRVNVGSGVRVDAYPGVHVRVPPRYGRYYFRR